MIEWSKYLKYSDGNLYWLVTRNNRVQAGTLAGTISDEGYVKVMMRRKAYHAHRIIWEMHYGKIPEGMEIDHINHDRTDNRIENLRLVTKQVNMKNKSSYSNNKSGVTGVSWHSKKKKWVAQIQGNKRKKMLYEGDSFNDAVKARKSAEIELNFHKNHGV